MQRLALTLVPRSGDALAPVGCCARGSVVPRLLRALLALDDARRAGLRGVVGDGVLVVLGAADALPWADGVRYLGEAAPGVFIETTRALDVPAPLAAAALTRHLPAALLVVDGALCVVPVGGALPITRAVLERAAGAGAA